MEELVTDTTALEAMIRSEAVRAVRQAFDLTAAFVAVGTGTDKRIAERHGLRDERWDDIVVRPGRGLGGRVLLEQRAISLTDYLDDSSITADYRTVVKAEGLRSIACVPVRGAAGLEYLLYLAAQERGCVPDRAVDSAAAVARMSVVAAELARERIMLAAQAERALRSDDTSALRAVARQVATVQRSPTDHGLTPRELDVIRLLADGASNIDLARELTIAESTAKEHVSHICRKLDARSRLEAVARARSAGVV